MKHFRKLVELYSIERHGLSCYGNPTLLISFAYSEGGQEYYIRAKTGSNCACGYSLTNYKMGDLVWLTFHFTKNGNCIVTRETNAN